MAETRYFALRVGGPRGREVAVFTGRSPRQAALKAASRGNTDIYLRERGTKKVHHFRGERRRVRAPANRPAWMSEMVWKPNVRKRGIIRLEAPRKAARKVRRAARRRTTVRRARRRTAARRTTRRRTARRTTARRRTARRTVRRTARRTTRRRRR
jgi:hypothetical protein